MNENKNCQSCGMPLKKDVNGPSKNFDNTPNKMYCSNCYENGAFKQPGLTVAQMQAIVKAKMKEMGFPGFVADFFTKGIPRLERWRQN